MDYSVIGVLEFSSIAAGIEAMDAMVKAAPVHILDAKTICPGKFYVVITGGVASVDASLQRGKKCRETFLIDELFIPNLHSAVIPAILGTIEVTQWEALGVIESFSIVSSIVAGDLAAKETDISLVEIRLATGLGGKSYVTMLGSVENVEASMDTATRYVRENGLLCHTVIIPSAHPDIRPFIV